MKKLFVILLLMALLAGCAPAAQQPESAPTEPTAQTETSSETTQAYIVAKLLCQAEDLEQAQQIAELYGITLVRFNYGLASFYTDEDPEEVIARGKENGWPELEINGFSQAFSN